MTWKIIKLSLKSIFNNKMRSFLTMLGIIIGVMAVVILVSITKGAASGITQRPSQTVRQRSLPRTSKPSVPTLPSKVSPRLSLRLKP